jgi:hypothetical protein
MHKKQIEAGVHLSMAVVGSHTLPMRVPERMVTFFYREDYIIWRRFQ